MVVHCCICFSSSSSLHFTICKQIFECGVVVCLRGILQWFSNRQKVAVVAAFEKSFHRKHRQVIKLGAYSFVNTRYSNEKPYRSYSCFVPLLSVVGASANVCEVNASMYARRACTKFFSIAIVR